MMIGKKCLYLLMILCMIAGGLIGCSFASKDGAETSLHVSEEKTAKMTMKDLETATLGIVTGTSWDLVAQKRFPNAERKYFL